MLYTYTYIRYNCYILTIMGGFYMDADKINQSKRVRFNTTLNQWILIKLKVLAAAKEKNVNDLIEELALDYIKKSFNIT